MKPKILNEIEGTDLVRIEENHQISIRRKDEVEEDKTTICGYEFSENWMCAVCDNYNYCKEKERER